MNLGADLPRSDYSLVKITTPKQKQMEPMITFDVDENFCEP